MLDEQKKALSLRAAYVFGAAKGLQQEVDDIRDMEIRWDRRGRSSLRRGFIVELFEKHSLLDEFKSKHWAFGATPPGDTKRRWYLRLKQEYDDFLRGNFEDEISDLEDEEIGTEFAAETHLRDFLSNNLSRIEPGLRNYSEGDRTGVEFQVDGGRIDILAIDAKRNYVVIELKVSRGNDRTMGQLLRYMGWVQQNLARGTTVRGVIVASEITETLKLAASLVPNVQLLEYEIEFHLKPTKG